MEINYSHIAVTVCAVTLLTWAWRLLNWVWLTPKKLESYLRRQGFRGNSYRLLFGDLKELSTLIKRAKSEPISITDDIVPRVIPFSSDYISKYGKKTFVWFGPKPTVHIMEPELIKEVLTKNFQYQKPDINPLLKLLVTGLAAYDKDKWVKHRKIINPAFHLEKLKQMVPAFYTSCNEMIRKWEEVTSEEGSWELDVLCDLQTLTSDVISRTAFGSSYEQGRTIFELQREQSELAVQVSRSLIIPGWRFLPTMTNKRMKEIERIVRGSLKEMISKRMSNKTEIETGNSSDLLGILLESNSKEIKEHKMSIDEVIEECKLFYFAGQETTSVLLVWTMVLLSIHPEWQDRARQEILQVFGDNKPDFDGLNHLKVVNMILYEVLRLYPPVVLMTRTIHEETNLGNMTLPVGVQLSLPIILIHHDTEIWGSDAKEFKPERFSDGISKATKGQQVAYFPFSWGPRICIGQNFAMLEAKMALALILQRFSFELSTSYCHAPYTLITLQPQYGAHLCLRRL